MLIVLLVLATLALILGIVMQSMVKKNQLGKAYMTLVMIQSGAIGAVVGILVVLLVKGRTLV